MRPVSGETRQRRTQSVGRDPASLARQLDQLEPAAEKFRRAALVGDDVGFGMAEHRAPGRNKLRQRERVRGGPGRHQEHRDIVLEKLRKPALDPPGRLVVAIAERKPLAGAMTASSIFGATPAVLSLAKFIRV